MPLDPPPPPPPGRPAAIHFLLLAGIVLLAAVLRLADLDGRPAGLFRDEVEKGYNAWALATSGGVIEFTMDRQPPLRWRTWPWMIDVMGSPTSAIYQYASIPFVRLGGLSVATTRMAAAVAGTLAVLAVGLLFMPAWGAGPGLAAALWLALSPWHLVLSRWALQSSFVPLLMALVLAGLWGAQLRRPWGWPLVGAALGWLFYAYSGAQPLVLAWGLALALIYRRALLRGGWPLVAGAVLFLIPVVPTVLATLAPGGAARLGAVAIWSDPAATPGGVLLRFITNYLAHLDPRFLFFSGDFNPRHGLSGAGQLNPLDLILLPVGLVWTLRFRRPLAWALLAAWLCAPLPAAITTEVPHGLRAYGMALPSAVWGGAGLWLVAGWIGRRSRRVFGILVWLAALAASASLVARYWTAMAGDPLALVAYEAGQRRAWEQLAAEKTPAQRVFIGSFATYAPYYHLFFMQVPPREAAARGLEPGGFYYFDQESTELATVANGMAPGDWLVFPVTPIPEGWPADAIAAGRPLLTPAEARRLRENWILLWQKPAE